MKIICANLLVVLIVTTSAAASGSYDGGNGTAEYPFRIRTAEHLCDIGLHTEDWDKCFVMVDNINLSGYSYDIIGLQDHKFTGTFDGNDFVITNLSINVTGVKFLGLFGFTGSEAEVKNTTLEYASVHNTGTCSATGVLVGYNVGTVYNCHSSGDIEADDCLGGLVGYNNSGTISECDANMIVSGGGFTGGLLGYNNSGEVTNSYAKGSVTGTGNIGGLIGRTYYGTITNCYATGSVTQQCSLGCFCAGGLVGKSYYGTVENCHASGQVNGSTVFGGLIGINYGGIVLNSYSTGQVIGDNSNDLGSFAGVNQFGTISRCYATGDASSNGDVVGGFVGLNTNESVISDCYSSGDAHGDESVGAMAGTSGSDSSIINCYSSGSASGNTNIGGFIGEGSSEESLYTGCFWHSSVNPSLSGVGNVDPDPSGVIAKSSIQLKKKSTFLGQGWDFIAEVAIGPNDVWRMCLDDVTYPRLYFEFIAGDFVCPDGVNLGDFAILAGSWNADPDRPNWIKRCDLNFDDLVQYQDLNILVENWLEQ